MAETATWNFLNRQIDRFQGPGIGDVAAVSRADACASDTGGCCGYGASVDVSRETFYPQVASISIDSCHAWGGYVGIRSPRVTVPSGNGLHKRLIFDARYLMIPEAPVALVLAVDFFKHRASAVAPVLTCVTEVRDETPSAETLRSLGRAAGAAHDLPVKVTWIEGHALCTARRTAASCFAVR